MNFKKFSLIIFISLLLPLSADALKVNNIECNNDGSLEFKIEGEFDDKIYTKDIGVIVEDHEDNGSWDSISIQKSYSDSQRYATFAIPEASLNENKIYKVSLNYTEDGQDKKKEFNAECPGLLFSCNLLNIDITKCSTQDRKFTAEFSAKGLKQSKLSGGFNVDVSKVLDFFINTDEPFKSRKNISYKSGPLPTEVDFKHLGNDNYILSFDFGSDNYVKNIRVDYDPQSKYPATLANSCKEKDYPNINLSDYTTCFISQGETTTTLNENNVTEEEIVETTTTIITTTTTIEKIQNNPITENVVDEQLKYNGIILGFVIVVILLLISIIINLYFINKKLREKL
ncbi:hypothetical protein CL617_02700 [archaeon]|nr:hypothetical protein [archaeon]|tara:strand:+ start:4481 stop:5506 length:1026 start_codon:yes stop_codon:yes gene_type:complete